MSCLALWCVYWLLIRGRTLGPLFDLALALLGVGHTWRTWAGLGTGVEIACPFGGGLLTRYKLSGIHPKGVRAQKLYPHLFPLFLFRWQNSGTPFSEESHFRVSVVPKNFTGVPPVKTTGPTSAFFTRGATRFTRDGSSPKKFRGILWGQKHTRLSGGIYLQGTRNIMRDNGGGKHRSDGVGDSTTNGGYNAV